MILYNTGKPRRACPVLTGWVASFNQNTRTVPKIHKNALKILKENGPRTPKQMGAEGIALHSADVTGTSKFVSILRDIKNQWACRRKKGRRNYFRDREGLEAPKFFTTTRNSY
jgi:hypothetical protein